MQSKSSGWAWSSLRNYLPCWLSLCLPNLLLLLDPSYTSTFPLIRQRDLQIINLIPRCWEGKSFLSSLWMISDCLFKSHLLFWFRYLWWVAIDRMLWRSEWDVSLMMMVNGRIECFHSSDSTLCLSSLMWIISDRGGQWLELIMSHASFQFSHFICE